TGPPRAPPRPAPPPPSRRRPRAAPRVRSSWTRTPRAGATAPRAPCVAVRDKRAPSKPSPRWRPCRSKIRSQKTSTPVLPSTRGGRKGVRRLTHRHPDACRLSRPPGRQGRAGGSVAGAPARGAGSQVVEHAMGTHGRVRGAPRGSDALRAVAESSNLPRPTPRPRGELRGAEHLQTGERDALQTAERRALLRRARAVGSVGARVRCGPGDDLLEHGGCGGARRGRRSLRPVARGSGRPGAHAPAGGRAADLRAPGGRAHAAPAAAFPPGRRAREHPRALL